MKLLIVDDSNVIRRSIHRLVNLAQITEVFHAGNGLEAIELCGQHHPEVVTMDITMPEMDGALCVPEMLAIKPDIRILVISALADKAIAISMVKRGAKGFLYKPFTSDQLNSALEELIS